MFQHIRNSLIGLMGLAAAMTHAQAADFDFEATKAQYSIRDYANQPLPERGYNYYRIAENIWFVHNTFDSMAFAVTNDGVVVVDARPDLTPTVLKVIEEVTDKPITHMIYTHHHRDHSNGAHLFPEGTIRIAGDATELFLKFANDPKRPLPDIVYEGDYVLETGGMRFELKQLERNWHSQDDTLVWAPEQKVLWAIDTFHPDAAPWIHWGESSDPWYAYSLPDVLMDQFDFNFVVVGHERIVGTLEHMQTYKSFIEDMKQTIMGIVKSDVYQASVKEIEELYTQRSTHYVYKASISAAADACAAEMIEKWQGVIRNASLNMAENCQTMFIRLVVLDP